MINTILFDLDGTLLPLQDSLFIKYYFNGIANRLSSDTISGEKLVETIWQGTNLMIQNDGTKTNEQVFFDYFTKVIPGDITKWQKALEVFYREDFIKTKKATSLQPLAQSCIETLKAKGYTIVLATNPIFPSIATKQRIEWAGLNEEDFIYITTY